MAIQIYNPFEEMHFDMHTCFLTGETLQADTEPVSIFPEWVLKRYNLSDQTFKMLDEGTRIQYKNLKVPYSKAVIEQAMNPLEAEIEKAFCAGYDEVVKIPEERLFQWMAKLMIGVLFEDLRIAQKKLAAQNDILHVSSFLKARFQKLHWMLQSLVLPMEFKGLKPWSIRVFRVKYSKDVFHYKDETNNLNFSLGMNDFGIVACLQDNGEVGKKLNELTDRIGDKTLHPIQFEELCARFIYSNYLLTSYATYNVLLTDEKVTVESIPLSAKNNTPLFDHWDDNMYGQVLANYWKPWGLTMKEIIMFPNPPISFIENDYNDEITDLEKINQPY
ncbi:hypothetical protein [Cytophaga hutchinsonii]|uniref:Uncharacterized protein n=1 Tax=Cytophaga hutchinsonii (strain ATCC 33406 / DSM 1761 / CIP 103989 / NBRC 15051 / NCIMB 9469 / D465) TaxID=269798 RepID=A0A6N4SVY9_CYTH3|nr:hypothetical protein [Cytophaga hutchinsonii]ABG60744.1 hypothetical protein CHU_3511 [Cytophaga hutchinsonii ATCC 33406]SFX70978.1 hypothetical protein SAMN04487930_10869 [Cytophaga hutchinsonii ATCC 33406]